MERLRERLAVARRALATLSELVGETDVSPVVRDAAIQRFEYTYETLWKAAQRFLMVVEGVQTESPKQAIRESRSVALLDSAAARNALAMADDRNLTAHTYNEALAEAIYNRLGGYSQLMDQWLRAMEERSTDDESGSL
jgi:nucleotidyltransferase substrate binding protein (TIGR01987 family)